MEVLNSNSPCFCAPGPTPQRLHHCEPLSRFECCWPDCRHPSTEANLRLSQVENKSQIGPTILNLRPSVPGLESDPPQTPEPQGLSRGVRRVKSQ